MDSLYDVLDLRASNVVNDDANTAAYLARLSTLSLADLTNNEPASLTQSTQSHIRNLQALSKRSQKAIITSSEHLESLTTILPSFVRQSKELRDNLPALETKAADFATKYERSTENAVLDRRKRALLLSRNADRVSDVLELPSLLASSVASAQAVAAGSTATAAASYSAALDLSAHVKRLSTLYSQSTIVSEISRQAEAEIQNLRTILITSLQHSSLKLAAAMRTIGWLRRVAPELSDEGGRTAAQAVSVVNHESTDGGLAALFLICRLRTLHQTLDALEPLRDLADQESRRRTSGAKKSNQDSALGSQSERYLKRYIEIFREQSFNIISMYRSIFPNGLPGSEAGEQTDSDEPLLLLPSPIVSFATHLVELLGATLKLYMPNVGDKSARESCSRRSCIAQAVSVVLEQNLACS
ncbi:hypothetical protein AMS68_002826 [Peltaster fructicola]|uniref:Conserved oligomeric Golgi complex subunit 8 n=1 Tax=Peltaster fructicola TaxID=286661 RepID=A0A6H0XRQ6_9PEZI|nr:hypothetical protein AMS68_002826 [Peltaster fructicola]